MNDGFGLFGFKNMFSIEAPARFNKTACQCAVKERSFRTSRCDRERLATKLPAFDPGGKLDQMIAHWRRSVAGVEGARI